MTTSIDERHGNAYGLGNAGERYAATILKTPNTEVRYTGNDRSKAGDYLVINTLTGEGKRIEVKTSRMGASGTYQACLYRRVKSRVCTNAQHSDFILWLCVPRNGGIPVAFLIPTSVTQGQKNMTIKGSAYAHTGKWAYYRVRHVSIFKLLFGGDRNDT